MTFPKRLLDEGASMNEMRLLRAGRAERPAPDLTRKTVAALSAGTLLLWTQGVAAGAMVHAGQVKTSTALKLLASKWWMLTMLGGVAVGGVVAVTHAPRTPAMLRPSASARVRVAAPAPENTKPTLAEQPAEHVERPVATASVSRPLPKGSAQPLANRRAAPEVDAPPAGVDAEIRSIDAIRAELRAGSPRAALRALDEHQTRFPQSAFRQEIEVLRIEAWMVTADSEAACGRGRQFLRQNPSSPHARRVETLLRACAKSE